MIRAVAKTLAFHSGALNLFHRMRNRECLTVLMFHRVLPGSEQHRLTPDPTYTVTPELLADCIAYCRSQYSIVGLDDVLSSLHRTRALPPWPLLITFDDGWRDNLQWAAPVLHGNPWLLFVATSAAQEPDDWWQEDLLRAARSGDNDYATMRSAAELEGARFPNKSDVESDELRLLLGYASLPRERRRVALASLHDRIPDVRTRQMASEGELLQLKRMGVSIGAHGSSHLPLTFAENAEADLRKARDWLLAHIGADAGRAVSFPHGRWNRSVANTARDLGFELMFTSDAILNHCPNGWLDRDVIGRIPIATHDISDAIGRLSGSRIAGWLHLRNRKSINVPQQMEAG